MEKDKRKTPTDEQIKEALTDIFDSVIKSSDDETTENFSEEIATMLPFVQDEDKYFLFSYRWGRIIRATLSVKYPKASREQLWSLEELYLYREFYDSNITEITSQLEGWQCSSDRASFILRKLEQHYGEQKDFDVMPKEDDEYTYHKPKVLNNEAWLKLFEALVRLRHGKNDLYLQWYAGYFIPHMGVGGKNE